VVRSLYLIIVFLVFLGAGAVAPFVFTLGYVWVDTFRPQAVALMFLNQLPVAMIMGVAAFGSYLAMDRRMPPRLNLATTLTVAMGIWITMTVMWAEVPDAAWEKWNWAFKTVMFSAFVPLVIRSRVQIEAFAQTYVFSLAANVVPFGLKTMISGGGYGRNLGLVSGNSNLSEGGLLSTLCLMMIPMAFFLAKHTQLLPRNRLTWLGYLGLSGLALITALGTFERSALIGMVVLGSYMLSRSRHKLVFIACAAVVVAAIVYTSSGAWSERISTIGDPTKETSALTRLLVWKWTFNYALSHPFGGGFQAYIIDRIEYPNGEVIFGRAFHSIYFELLGEQGWVGLGMFLTIGISTVLGLVRLSRRTRKIPQLEWCADMSDALQSALVTFLAAATFVGIAFQPMFWYFIAMAISLREYVRRAEQPVQPSGWRARLATATPISPEAPMAQQGWRQRPALGRGGR